MTKNEDYIERLGVCTACIDSRFFPAIPFKIRVNTLNDKNKMSYAEDILRILEEAGESGLPLQKIARHVFNASNSLFCPIEEAEVRRHVRRFLCRNCRDEHSLIERTRRGFYRLNTENYECQQLFLPFREADTDTEQPAADTDRSLSLF